MEDSLMKFKIINDKLKMEIKLSDLVWLFHNSPNNMNEYGVEQYAKVKRGKRKEFAEWIVKMLQDDSPWDDNNVSWGQMFEDAFSKYFEGFEMCDNIIECKDDDYDDYEND